MFYRRVLIGIASLLGMIVVSESGHTQDGVDPVLRAAIAGADVAAGQALSLRCVACHTFDAGGADRVGPNLYEVVGRVKGGKENFNYSPAFQALAAAGSIWTYEDLNSFLADPRVAIVGTRMGVAGISGDADRHNLIAYLRSLSASPAPLE